MPQVFSWSDDEFDDRARGLAALIRRVWRAIARQVAANVEQQKAITMAAANPIPAQWQQAVDDQIVGFVRNVYLDAAGGISDALNAPDELLVGDDLVEVYTNAARNRLVGIGDDVWKNVQAQITLGNQSGESIADIAARIRNVAGVSEGRSLTIARTEVHAAFESGSYEQAMFVDPKGEKVWLATEDERTRPSHRAVDGQRVKIGESFDVGGSKLRFPGDPLGAPEDCINCRCSVAYDFDMITTVVEEPEPAMVAAGGQAWKPHMHPRGNDGKFIEKGAISDFLKKDKPNIIDVTKAVSQLNPQQWDKLTDAQKTHIESSVDKLPKGTQTHDHAKSALDSVKQSSQDKTTGALHTVVSPDNAPKPKTKIGETYAKLKDAKHGDVLATGTKYSPSGVVQKFKITADKSSIHPDYNPHGKMKLEFLKKNGEPSDKSYTGGILSISQKLHPLPVKGKSGKVEWDEPGAVATANAQQSAPARMPKAADLWQLAQNAPHNTVLATGDYGGQKYKMITVQDEFGAKKIAIKVGSGKGATGSMFGMIGSPSNVEQWLGDTYNWQPTDALVPPKLETINSEPVPLPGITPPAAGPAKIPAGLKGVPGDPAKITTGVVWGKHPAGTTIVESEDGNDKIVWNGKKYEFQSLDDIGDWATQFEMSKKDFYAQHKEDTAWKVPGGEKTHQPLDLNTPEMDQAFGDPNAPDMPDTPDEALGYEPTPDDVDFYATQWERENAGQATSEPPQTPSTPPVSTTSAPDWTQSQDFSGFTKVGGQAGSNPGGKYKAPDGTEWYIKQPKSAKHAANEQAAAAFYNLAGIDAPQVMIGGGASELGGKFQTGTKIVPGAKANLGSKLNDEAYLKQIQSGFAMDAWLANWDVAGMGYDNVVEGADGKPHRIDVGGALLFRAQGDPKGDKFGDTVDELETLRNSGLNPTSAKVFGSMTDEDIRKSAAKLEAISNEQIDQIIADAGLPYSVAQTLKNRRAHILSKYPPISEADELPNEVLDPPTTTTTPDAASAMAKLKKLYEKGLITEQEYIDAAGENPDGSDPYGGVADKGVLLNDLESGAILPATQAIDLALMLDKSDYDDLSQMDKDQLETTLSTAANMDVLGGKDAYAHWQSLHNTPNAPSVPDTSTLTDEPDKSGPATSADGALYYLDQGEESKMVSSDGKYVIEPLPNSPMGKYSLETKQDDGSSVFAYINSSDDIEYVTSQIASLWYPAKKTADADAVDAGPTAPSGPMIDGSSLGLKPLHSLIQGGKTGKKYTDGQVIATSPDGDQQIIWRNDLDSYTVRDTASGSESFISIIHAIKNIRSDAWHVPENLLTPNHGGTLVPNLVEPGPNDPLTNDVDSIGVTNGQALLALHHGDTDKLVTIDGTWEIYKSPNGKWTALKQNHPNDTSTITLLDDNDTADLDKTAGPQVWYPQDAIDNAKASTSGTAGQPLDPDVIQEKIDLGEYTAGEVVAVTEDGQHQLIYSPIVNGLVYQFKVGNTGNLDLDWDTDKVYDGSADTPISEFVDEHPDVKLFEPQDVNVSGDDDPDVTNWEPIISGPYVYNDVVAEAGDNGKWQLVNKDDEYALYKKDNATGHYNLVSNHTVEDLYDLTLPDDADNASWLKVDPGTKFKSGKFPAKKAFAKKVAKAAGVPQTYSAATVSPGEKKFYLDDAEDGSLVPAEVIHLLNGAGGLDLDDAKALTPKQTANINKALEKAIDGNMAGGQAAHDKWAGFEQQLNAGNGAPQIADHSYFLDMEDAMWAGDKSTGDILAITPDDKYRIMVHSTTGPGENPDSFAMEVNGPYGWETIQIYANNDPANKLAGDPYAMGKTWVIPDSNDDGSGAPADVLDNASVTFDPPGHGTQLPGTIFDMLSWVPEGKALLVGKTASDVKYVMTADKNSANNTKSIKVSYWDETDKTFKLSGYFSTEQAYAGWASMTPGGIKWDAPGVLPDKSALDDYMGNPDSPDVNAPAAPTAPLLSLTSDNVDAIWDKIQTLDIGTVIGTTTGTYGKDRRLLVGLSNTGAKIPVVQQKNDSGTWIKWNDVSKTGLEWALADYAWTSEIHDMPTSPSSPPTAPTPTAPSAPSVSTPAAVKAVPLYKINILKGNMKTDGNVGYWSKPEKIWEQIQKFQKLPGNENFSPIDFLTALDSTLKTDKHSYVAKMTKWAATKKGAQTIGQDGIYGSTTSTPAATSNGVIDLKPENIDAIWDKVQSLPSGTIFAMSEKGDVRLKVAGGSPGSPKYLIAESKSAMGSWQYYHAGGGTKDKLKKMLESDQNPNSGISPYNWKMVTPSTPTPTALPNIEAGNDISGIDAVKQKQVYDAFKANPGTYLSSSQAFENFDAFQSVAKSEGLTLGQVINIIDEQGAIKVSKPNDGLFKKKIADWLKTPEAAAHILNEPKTVTGLPTPPEFTPEYHPDLHLPSFEESNKYTYDYVQTTHDATKIWKDITTKTKPHSESEKSALKVWTGGAYSSINTHLYSSSSSYSSLSSTHKSAMKNAQKGMRPSDRPMILVRGTYFDGLGNAKNHQQLEKLIGTTWRNNAFAATSVGQGQSDQPGVYSPAFSSLPLWVEFECPPGTPMSWVATFSQHGHEREMLLAADLHYQILSVEKKTIPGYGVKSVARVRIVPKPEGAAA